MVLIVPRDIRGKTECCYLEEFIKQGGKAGVAAPSVPSVVGGFEVHVRCWWAAYNSPTAVSCGKWGEVGRWLVRARQRAPGTFSADYAMTTMRAGSSSAACARQLGRNDLVSIPLV